MSLRHIGQSLFGAVLLSVSTPLAAIYDLAVTQEVDNPYPTDPSQTVEFKVTVEHLGGASLGTVTIRDKLPPELQLPQVMAPHASTGQYDAETGNWDIDFMEPGQREVLVIPAVYRDGRQSACAVNIARFNSSDDEDQSNNESRTALYAPGVDACADLWLSANKDVDVKDPCDPDKQVHYTFTVHNAGPDDARNIRFTIEEIGEFNMPGLQFTSPGCSGFSCNLATLAAGARHEFTAQSRVFSAQPADGHTLRMTATTTTVDYLPDNNTGEHNFRFGGNEGFCIGSGESVSGLESVTCFIATAAYGTPMDKRISVLRQFRDRWLLTNAPGRAFVEAYNTYSPPVAEYIAEKPALRAVVRGALFPVVVFLSYPVLCLASLVVALLLVRFRLKKT